MRWAPGILIAAIVVALSAVMPGSASALPRLSAEPDPVGGGRIVDVRGREVLLRGVNVNSLAEYWQGTANETTLPLQREDPGLIAGFGWNTVRLLVSWSRIEPRPGRYDEDYLDRVERWVGRFEREGLYTIIDLHQDAWGPTLAARDDEVCPSGYQPAYGWDGAPGWATLDEDEPRCFLNSREINPAVQAAWSNFFADAEGPGGVGTQTRYVRMLRHVAERFAGDRAMAAIDVMNEPNAFGAAQNEQLSAFYEQSVEAIRRGERRGNGFRHLILIEPSVLWSLIGQGPPPSFEHDRGIVYSPHLYGGSIGGEGPPSEQQFATARAEAAQNFGGAPVLTGEWGGNPDRATGESGDYFLGHQALQDEYGISATLWQWKQSCGDPHAAPFPPDPPAGWSVFEMDCLYGANEVVGIHPKLAGDLRRGYVRRAPGELTETTWDPKERVLRAGGIGAKPGMGPIEIWFPVKHLWNIRGTNLGRTRVSPSRNRGIVVTIEPRAPRWSLVMRVG